MTWSMDELQCKHDAVGFTYPMCTPCQQSFEVQWLHPFSPSTQAVYADPHPQMSEAMQCLMIYSTKKTKTGKPFRDGSDLDENLTSPTL